MGEGMRGFPGVPWGSVYSEGVGSIHHVAAGTAAWRLGAGPCPGPASCASPLAQIHMFCQCRCDSAACPTGPKGRSATCHRRRDT